jgi:hypothetical protein
VAKAAPHSKIKTLEIKTFARHRSTDAADRLLLNKSLPATVKQ